MSLSGNQLTGIGPVQVTQAYLGFIAKVETVGTALDGGGSFIFLKTRSRLLKLDTTSILIPLNSNVKVVML